MAARTIDGPEDDHLTREQVAKYLKMEVRTLQRLIERGDFPRSFELSPGTHVWHWSEIWAYSIMRRLQTRCYPTKTRSDKEGQPKTTPSQSRTIAKRPVSDP